MRGRLAIAGLTAGLLFGTAPALAFEQTPVPPIQSSEKSAPQKTVPTAPMQLGTANAPVATEGDRKGLNVFGYTVFPKLNFGLDVLYGEEQQQLELQHGASTLEEKGDISVLGKVKRRF